MPALSYELKDTVLDVSDVSLAIDGVPILKDVKFQVRDVVRPGMKQGQVIALLTDGASRTKSVVVLRPATLT